MAVAGLVLQVIFAAVMLAVWLATGSLAAMSCTWLLAAGLAVWLMVLVLFYCRQLERREAEELEDIAAHAGGGGTIFTGDQEADHRPAARRLAWMERWVVPIFTILWACMHAAAGAVAMRYLLNTQAAELTQAAPAVLFLLLIGFLAFLFSRYAIGMSSERQWRLLRAAGSYLLVNVLAIAGVVAALLSASQGYGYVDAIAAYVIPIVQLVLAAELLLNFVLDLYRPRLPGQEHRPSFDSRLLNLIAEPSKVGHSVAETLNYQFGFEVSKTWFYQLIGRAFGPLLIFGVVVLFAMSSLVVVREGEQYIVLHWGRADPAERTLRPGLHLKWPWPIDTAMRFQTGKVHEILLGAGPARSAEERRAAFVKGRELYLWTEEHGRRKELNFLVANPVPAREAREADKRPPVSIIRLVVPVQYRVHNVYDYYRRMQDAERMLEQIASREMVRYCASATLNAPAGEKAADRPEAIMTYGRRRAAAELKRRIQEEADNLSLGVEITYVGMLAVHPPPEAAPAFQDVLKAERKQDQMRYQAEAEAADMLAE
ncbi:MAG: SPFH domain-containing protein, partial [Planctomycetota bacterium]|nr:SPFH domain-containing protein [Planctomycetota bacterium]